MHWLMSSALPCVRPLGCLCHACGPIATAVCAPLPPSQSLPRNVNLPEPAHLLPLQAPRVGCGLRRLSGHPGGVRVRDSGIFRLDLVVLSPLGGAELANGVGCATSDGCSSGAERGASLLHGPSGLRVYQDQSSV